MILFQTIFFIKYTEINIQNKKIGVFEYMPMIIYLAKNKRTDRQHDFDLKLKLHLFFPLASEIMLFKQSVTNSCSLVRQFIFNYFYSD